MSNGHIIFRDVVIDFQKEAIRGIGAAIRGHKGVSIEIKNIGQLIYSGGVLKATFNSDFVAQFQVSIPVCLLIIIIILFIIIYSYITPNNVYSDKEWII